MKIIGCDFHTRQQQIEMLDRETGEVVRLRLEHANGEARRFYEELQGPAMVGIEATGYTRWFEQMLGELGHELWVGDAARIRAAVVRKQKNDERDAEHLCRLLCEGRFPRIWMPSLAERDLRQLVLHRVKLVQMRTKVMNQLHALAMGQGLCRKRKLWSEKGRAELEALELGPWPRGGEKNCWIIWRGRLRSCSGRPNGKQGSTTTRWLLVEAGQTAARRDAELRRLYQRLKFRRCSQVNYAELAARMVRTRGSSGSGVLEAVGPSMV